MRLSDDDRELAERIGMEPLTPDVRDQLIERLRNLHFDDLSYDVPYAPRPTRAVASDLPHERAIAIRDRIIQDLIIQNQILHRTGGFSHSGLSSHAGRNSKARECLWHKRAKQAQLVAQLADINKQIVQLETVIRLDLHLRTRTHESRP